MASRARLVAQGVAIGLVALLFILLAWSLLNDDGGDLAKQANRGDRPTAPDFTLERLDRDGELELSSLRGKAVVLNLWASWCIPCREEAPALESFQRREGDRGFTVLGIDSRDLSGDGRAFARRYGLSYPQLRDGDGATAHDFGTTGVPENYLIDPQGKVRLLVRGPITADYLEDEVAPLLAGGSS